MIVEEGEVGMICCVINLIIVMYLNRELCMVCVVIVFFFKRNFKIIIMYYFV